MKLENTYLAIMSRHVSVSSRWRFFKLSSAWAIEFSSADPRLALVRDVWILLEGGAPARSGVGRGHSSPTGGQSSRHASAGRATPTNPPPGRTPSRASPWQTTRTHQPREEGQGLTGETQAHSSEQRLRRQGTDETDVPSPKHRRVRGRLGGGQFSHAETQRPQTHRDCILPTGPPPDDREGLGFVCGLFPSTRPPQAPHAPSDQEKRLVQV